MEENGKCGLMVTHRMEGIGTIEYKCSLDIGHESNHRCQTYHPDTGAPGYAVWTRVIDIVAQPDASASPGEWSDYFWFTGIPKETRVRVMRFSTGGAWATHTKLPFMPCEDSKASCPVEDDACPCSDDEGESDRDMRGLSWDAETTAGLIRFSLLVLVIVIILLARGR